MGARGRKSKAELLTKQMQPAPEAPPPIRDPRLPRDLGQHGLALWRSITAEFQIQTSAAAELLCQACQALDRAEDCAAQIAHDGVMTESGKEHPLIKHELAARAFVTKVIQRLELEL